MRKKKVALSAMQPSTSGRRQMIKNPPLRTRGPPSSFEVSFFLFKKREKTAVISPGSALSGSRGGCARFIFHCAAEQKESSPTRSAAIHIRQGVNDQKPAPTHPRPAFLFRGQLLLFKRTRKKDGKHPAWLYVKWRLIRVRAVELLLRR